MGHGGCVRIVYIGSAADGVFFLNIISFVNSYNLDLAICFKMSLAKSVLINLIPKGAIATLTILKWASALGKQIGMVINRTHPKKFNKPDNKWQHDNIIPNGNQQKLAKNLIVPEAVKNLSS